DLVVAHARGNPGEHLALPVGEYRQRGGVEWLGRAAPGDAGDERAGDAWRQQGIAAGDHPDGADEVFRLGVLDQEAARPGPDRLEDILVRLVGGENDDAHAAQFGVGGG